MTEYTGTLSEAKILELLKPDTVIADDMDDADIQKMQSDCQALYEKDYASCQEWRDDAKKLLEIARLKDKTRSQYIKKWQADIQMPDLIYAAMSFNARTFPEYVKDGKVCQARQVGKQDDKKRQRGERVCKYLNWQLTEQMQEWTENFDKLLLILPIVGHAFKVTMWDEQLGRPTDTLLMPDMVTVDNTPNNPDWNRRISLDYKINQNMYAANIAAGVWRKTDIQPDEGTTEDPKYSIVQMHTWWDVDKDGYAEPYILTFCKENWTLLSVVPRYDINSIQFKFNRNDVNDRTVIGIEPVEYITSYSYFPAPDGSALGMGLGHIIKDLSKARNTAINQIQDAGTKINLSSGLIRSGVFRDDGVEDFEPGEFKIVDAGFSTEDIQKSIFALPVNQPSSATFSVFTTMGDTINRIGQTGEIMSGEGVPANMPATSVLAIIEQGKVGQRVVLKRINASLSRELAVLFRLNSSYLNDDQYTRILDERASVQEDFDLTNCDIVPVADPMFSTRVERLMRAQAAMQAGIQSPVIMQSYLVELGYSDEEAQQIAAGDSQMKAVQAQAEAQSKAMQQHQEVLKQQEATNKSHADAMDRETRLMEAKIRLAEMESRLMLDRANAAKIMAETMALEDENGFKRNELLLQHMPPAMPTIGEIEDDQSEPGESAEHQQPESGEPSEVQPGGIPTMGERPDNAGVPGGAEAPSGQPEQSGISNPAGDAIAARIDAAQGSSGSNAGGGDIAGIEGSPLPE